MTFSDPARDPYDDMYDNSKGLGPMHPEDHGDEQFIGPMTEEDQYWSDCKQPCGTCGSDSVCRPDCAEDAYNKRIEERVNRLGPELAMLPDWMECYSCGREHLMAMTDKNGFKFVWRRPNGLGPIAEPNRDPTQMYKLECGHLAL